MTLNINNKKLGGVIMNEKILGSVYIIIAVLIMIVWFAARWFFVYLVWIIAIALLIYGAYLLFFRR